MLARSEQGRPRRVAFVANTLWYLLTFRKSTIVAAIQKGWSVLCIGQAGPAAAGLRALGCAVTELDWRLDSMNAFHEAAIVAQITQSLARSKVDLVFSFTIKANLNASIACRLLRTPYCTNVSGLGTAFLRDEFRYRLVRRLFGFANSGAHTTFFQNQTDLDLFTSMGLSTGKRSALIPGSGVDLHHFAYVPPRPRVRAFLMIARLIRDKGVMEYLAAARQLTETEAALQFRLAGPLGVQNASALTLRDIEGYGVTYLGELADVRPAIHASDCVVLPSYREGMPKVILEAASIGRMAIVSDAPGCRDAVSSETGFLCEPRSVSSLANAMREVISLDAKAIEEMSKAARRRAEEHFSEEKCRAPYVDLLGQLSPALKR